jgi:hypothetical protein
MSMEMDRRSFMAGGMVLLSGLAFAKRSLAEDVPEKIKPDLSDMTFLNDKVVLIKRDEWTDIKPQLPIMKAATGYDRLTIHHTGETIKSLTDENSIRFALLNILNDHCNRNFGDIGYHFVIAPDGKVWQTRSMAYEGAHVSGQNASNLGVMLLGNFESNQPTDGQISTMTLLTDSMCEHFSIKKHRVYGHRDIGHSLCPGRNLYEEVLKLKSIDTVSQQEVAHK